MYSMSSFPGSGRHQIYVKIHFLGSNHVTFFCISVHLFSPFGHVFVSWIDDTSAFVSLKDKDWANQILPTLQSRAQACRIQSYEDFLKSKENSSISSQSCGITPTLEKVPFNLPGGRETSEPSKRSANDDQRSTKRL